MYAAELISRNIRFTDNLLESSKDGKERRARHAEFLQEGVIDHWLRREWDFSYKENASFAVTAASQKALLPVDFMEFGRDGGVYIAGTNMAAGLDECSPRQIQAMRRAGHTQSPPTVYSTFDSDSNGRVYLQLANGSDVTLHLYYRRKPPTIIDKPLAPVVAEDVAGLLNGTYNWAISHVTADGESELGFLSSQLIVALKEVLITDIEVSPLAEVTAHRVYRNATGSAVMKLEETISDNLTTTVQTNVADGALGAAYPSGLVIYTGLELFPIEHVYRVLRPYMRYRGHEDKGDVRGEMWKGKYEEGVGWAARMEVPGKHTQQQMSGFGLEHLY